MIINEFSIFLIMEMAAIVGVAMFLYIIISKR